MNIYKGNHNLYTYSEYSNENVQLINCIYLFIKFISDQLNPLPP